jgi:hypothetical protein
MRHKCLKRRSILMFVILTFVLLVLNESPLLSQNTTASSQEKTTAVLKPEIVNEILNLRTIKEASDKFKSLGFGIAVGLSFVFKSYVLEAEAENGIVRAKKEASGFADMILETHKFWPVKSDNLTPSALVKDLGYKDDIVYSTIGLGPFFSILLNNEDIISAVAFGGMIGFRPDKSSPGSLNFGIGPMFKFNQRILRDDLKLDQALPEGLKEVKYQEKSLLGLAVVFSFTWANL